MPRADKSSSMPKCAPAPDELIAQFNRVLQSIPEAETRRMFGYPADHSLMAKCLRVSLQTR